MKIAVASIFDPWSSASWSGCSRNLLRALVNDYGATPIALGPIAKPSLLQDRVLAQFSYWRGRSYIAELTEPSLRYFAARTAEKLAGLDCDCVLALDGPTVAYLETDLPIYYFWDCTFEGNLEYPWFAKLTAPCLAAGHVMERNAIRNAAMSFYSSQWAVDSAIRSYGADPLRTKIVPLAANIDCERTPSDVEQLILNCSTETVQLLFLGIDWLRKGGDLDLAVARELNARGTPAIAVFAEASSFGTPSLARRVGGVDSVVAEGINGHLFDRHATAAAYCETIESLWSDPDRYRALARSSFRHFKDYLTWNFSAGKLLGYITEDLRNRA